MSPIRKAIQLLGGPAAAARALGCSVQAACFYRDELRSFPIEFCPRVEELLDGEVMRWHLRPDDWADIWPELSAHPKAPKGGKSAKAVA